MFVPWPTDDDAIITCNIILVACWFTTLVSLIVIGRINLGIKQCLSREIEIGKPLSAAG